MAGFGKGFAIDQAGNILGGLFNAAIDYNNADDMYDLEWDAQRKKLKADSANASGMELPDVTFSAGGMEINQGYEALSAAQVEAVTGINGEQALNEYKEAEEKKNKMQQSINLQKSVVGAITGGLGLLGFLI